MAEIAAQLRRALAERAARGAPGGTTRRVLAEGDGWKVADVICTSGPRDRPFEERHAHVDIAVVAAGSFQYRSAAGRVLLTPGALLLGDADQGFECAHDHAAGDRCLSFQFAPAYFEGLRADAGLQARFPVNRLPPLRPLAAVVARALAGLTGAAVAWEELALQVVAQTARALGERPAARDTPPPSAVARVTRIVRAIECDPDGPLDLGTLARQASLSRYHFLRTFEGVTGVTPHQYVVRARLRRAATRLAAEPARILDVALDSGFGDLSHFNRSFRAEFGASPRAFRRAARSTA